MDGTQLLREIIDARIAARKARMAEIGAIGGRMKSERKTAACRENVKKAQAKRWPGRPVVDNGQ